MEVHGQLDLLLLATIERLGQAHGYAVIADLRRRSEGDFDLAEGTVYPALHRLERGGAITTVGPDAPAGRPRRSYRLTGAGAALLAERRQQWEAFVAAVHRSVGHPRPV